MAYGIVVKTDVIEGSYFFDHGGAKMNHDCFLAFCSNKNISDNSLWLSCSVLDPAVSFIKDCRVCSFHQNE
jgi:hypothetical protein